MKPLAKYFVSIFISILPLILNAQDQGTHHYYKARDLCNRGNYSEALEELNIAIECNPNFPKAYAQRARVRMWLHQFELASVDYNKAVALNSEYLNDYTVYAPLQALSESHKGLIFITGETVSNNTNDVALQDHLRSIQDRISFDPFDTAAYLKRAYLNYNRDSLAEAIVDVNKALEIDSSLTYPFYLLSMIYDKQKDYNTSIYFLTKCIEKGTNFYLYYFLRGMAHIQLDNLPAAISDLESAAHLNEKNAAVLYNLAVCYKVTAQFEKALEMFDKAIISDSKLAVAYFNRAYVNRHQNNLRAALRDYNHYISLRPYDALAYNNRGNIWMLTGDYAQAREDYNYALSLNEGLCIAYLNRGINGIMRGYKEEACLDFNEAAALGNTSAIRKRQLHCF